MRNIVSYFKAGRSARPITGLALGLVAAMSIAGAAHAAPPMGTFVGNAYGTDSTIKVGPLALGLGKTGLVSSSCGGTDGETITNRVDSLSVGAGVLNASVILNTAYTNETSTSATVQHTSTIQGLSALNGLITADSIIAVANTTATGTTVNSDADGSTFANLKIAGNAIPVDVAPNTHIGLPGLGDVTLRKVTPVGRPGATRFITVEMISINVTVANSLGLPVGATVVVAHAVSGFNFSTQSVAYSGTAFAASANAAAGDIISNQIGRAAFIGVPCLGSNGATLTSNIGAVSVPGIVSFGAGTTSAFGNGGVAKTTTTLTGVNLLGGIIHASAVNAVAQTALSGGVRTRSTAGSGFTGLSILGLPLPLNVAPNTQVVLPGIGYVILNQQTIPSATSTAITRVIAIHIYVTTRNIVGLPVGAQLIVGYAGAGVVMPKVTS